MIHLIDHENQYIYARELDAIFRLRHRILSFYQKYHLKNINGRLIDQFDTSNTLYLAKILPDGSVGASMRLNRTIPKSFLSEIVRLNTNEAPLGPTVWECTHYCVQKSIDSKSLFDEFCVALIELALIWEIEALSFLIDTPSFVRAVAIGWDLKKIAAQDDKSKPGYTIGLLHITRDSLRQARRATGLETPQICVFRPDRWAAVQPQLPLNVALAAATGEGHHIN